MDTLVSIDLPLPLDITGSLLAAVGSMYPNAQIVTDGDPAKLTLAIADADRAGLDGDGMPAQIPRPTPADTEALLTSLRDGSIGVSPPEWFAKMMLSICAEIVEASSAENYVEMTLHGKGPDGEPRTWAVVVARSHDQTPHQLRIAADQRAERYAERLRELGQDPAAI